MLYHYTTQAAFKSILCEAKTHQQMCFWASRYDCFADTEEFKLGIETIQRLLPEIEKELPKDRRITPLFDWNEIKDNKNLPNPYIVSLTTRLDNEYMWKEYATKDGVVLELDNTQNVAVPEAPILRLAPCIYTDDKSDDKIIEMLRQEYHAMGISYLMSPHKEEAFGLLKNSPQAFVKLIAIALLSLTAPRIKGARDYWMEEETRIIIPLPSAVFIEKIKGYDDTISSLGLNPKEIKKLVADEHTRKRDNGSVVYYRKIHLPIQILKGIYVKSKEAKELVETFVRNKGLSIPILEI